MEFDVFILVLDLDSSFFRSCIAVSKLYFLENSAMLFIVIISQLRWFFLTFAGQSFNILIVLRASGLKATSSEA